MTTILEKIAAETTKLNDYYTETYGGWEKTMADLRAEVETKQKALSALEAAKEYTADAIKAKSQAKSDLQATRDALALAEKDFKAFVAQKHQESINKQRTFLYACEAIANDAEINQGVVNKAKELKQLVGQQHDTITDAYKTVDTVFRSLPSYARGNDQPSTLSLYGLANRPWRQIQALDDDFLDQEK